MKKILCAYLAAVISVGSFNVRADHIGGEIPDEIDVVKYKNLYEAAQEFSSRLRAEAEKARSVRDSAAQTLSRARTEIGQLTSGISQNELRIATMRDEANRLSAENSILRAQVQRDQAQHDNLHRQAEGMRAELAQLNFANHKERHDLDELQKIASVAHERFNRIKEEHAQSHRTLQELKDSEVRLERRVQVLKQEQATKQARLHEATVLKTKLESELAQLQGAIDTLEAEVSRLKPLVAESSRKVKEAETNRNSLKSESDALSAKLSTAKSTLQNSQSRVQALQTEVANLNATIQSSGPALAKQETDLHQAEQQIFASQATLNEVNPKITDLQDRLSPKQERLKDLQQQKSQKDKVLAEKRKELEKLKRMPRPPVPILELIKRLEADIAVLENAVAELQAKITPLSAEVSALIAELRPLIATRDQATKTLADAQKAAGSARTAIAAIKSQLNRAEERLAPAQSELATAIGQRDSAQADVKALQPLAEQAQRELNQAQATLDNEQKILSELKPKLDRTEASLALARKQLQDRPAELARLETEIAQIKKRLPEIQSDLVESLGSLSEARKRIPIVEARMRELSMHEMHAREAHEVACARVTQQTRIVEAIEINIRTVRDELGRLNIIIVDLHERIERTQPIIDRNQSGIATREERVRVLSLDNTQMRDRLDGLNRGMPNMEQALSMAENDLQGRDGAARLAETDTANRLAKYSEVQARYNGLLASADKKGRDQGVRDGEPDGSSRGRSVGVAAGDIAGTNDGRKEGLEFGYQNGLKKGEEEGKAQGYAKGLNSKENHDIGFSAGRDAGIREALDEARRTEYPKGFSERMNEILSRLPDQKVTLDNDLSGRISTDGLHLIQTLMSEKVVSNKLIRDSDNFVVRSVLSMSMSRTPNPPVLDPGEIIVDESRADCNVGYVDFVSACKGSYRKAFIEKFLQAFRLSSAVAFTGTYEPARKAAFEASKDTRYEEGYKETYFPTFSKAEQLGAEEAISRGRREGRDLGYGETIAKARLTERERGIQEADKAASENPVIRAKSSELVAGGAENALIPGSPFAITLRAVNYGGVNSERGQVQILAEPLTDNISLDSTMTTLVGIPAQSVAEIRNVFHGQVKSGTLSNQPIRIRVTVKLPDGSSQVSVAEARTQLSVVVKQELNYDKKPDVQTGFWKNNHTVKSNVTNLSKSPEARGAFRVFMTATDPRIVILTGESVIKELQLNQMKTASLVYELKDKSVVGQTLNLKVSVAYVPDGRIISEETVTITPVD
ncbi:MAG: hypothetical protein AABZ06_15355 [Bdellovibrionota bacterium]